MKDERFATCNWHGGKGKCTQNFGQETYGEETIWRCVETDSNQLAQKGTSVNTAMEHPLS
jgi:hypothetical protein